MLILRISGAVMYMLINFNTLMSEIVAYFCMKAISSISGNKEIRL